MTDLDKAYAAGIVDGEGCITAYARKDSRSTRLCISIAMCGKVVIDWLKEMFPGGCQREKNAAINKRYGWKRSWVFIASDRRAAEIIELIYPFLKLKHRQAELCLELAKLKRTGSPRYPSDYPRQLAIVEEVQRLNAKGPSHKNKTQGNDVSRPLSKPIPVVV